MKSYSLNLPLFGLCYLIPHPVSEDPDEAPLIGYVDFGDDTQLTQAIYHRGEWCGRNMRPLDREVVRWYHTEKPDGSRLF